VITPVILATQEAEIRRTAVQSQPGQIVCEILPQKKKKSQKRAGGVVQGVGSEFKPHTTKKGGEYSVNLTYQKRFSHYKTVLNHG
jgi:hypothetical protein